MKWGLKLLLVVLVCWGVSGTVSRAFTQLSGKNWSVEPIWLGASGILYFIGLSAQGWFWHHSLRALGQQVPRLATARAYFLGHLGKYVPGKALVVILRVAGVRPWVPSLRVGVTSTLLETLTMMAVGASLAAILTILFLDLPPLLVVLAVGMAVGAGLPTVPPVARFLASVGTKDVRDEPAAVNRPPVPSTPDDSNVSAACGDGAGSVVDGIDAPLLASGWIAATICWTFMGLSLWAVLRSLGVSAVAIPAQLPLLVAAVSLAVVAGFLSLLPGGLLVRDALLMQMLAPACGDAAALIATVLLRLVWLVTELGVCGILYMGARYQGRRPPS